jgi:hypothetical protein
MVPSLTITDGTARALFAYDVGQQIDLTAAQAALGPQSQREPLSFGPGSPRAPRYFDFRPPPLRVRQAADLSALPSFGPFRGEGSVEVTLYDVGAVSVAYPITLRGPLEGLIDLADGLYECGPLLDDSRRRVEALVSSLGPAVHRPRLTELVEDYVLYQIRRTEPSTSDPAPWSHPALRPLLARILRAEKGELSSQEIEEALANTVCYTPHDAAVLDWNASLLFGEQTDDTAAVLEFMNVELLELRFIDDRLDAMLETLYDRAARPRRASLVERFRLFPSREERESLRRITGLQVDAALLYEATNNALKLLGDQHLARVYRRAATRLHLPDWEASVLRKLETVDDITQKLRDTQATRRMEILEWLIILLIFISILQAFFMAAK